MLVSLLQFALAGAGLAVALYPLAIPIGVLAAHAVMVRWFHGGAWSVVGLDRDAARPRRWLYATVLAALAIAVPTLLLLAGGLVHFASMPEGSWPANALWLAFLLIPAAFGEELIMRGYLFALMREVWGWRWAIAVTSVGFGALHLANPGVHPQAIVTVILAGVFLGFVLVRTGSLYAAWAAHAAWNLTLAGVFHADVSGLTLGSMPYYRLVDSGPDWVTGGAWGPEGGIAAAAGLLAATILLARPRLLHGNQPDRSDG